MFTGANSDNAIQLLKGLAPNGDLDELNHLGKQITHTIHNSFPFQSQDPQQHQIQVESPPIASYDTGMHGTTQLMPDTRRLAMSRVTKTIQKNVLRPPTPQRALDIVNVFPDDSDLHQYNIHRLSAPCPVPLESPPSITDTIYQIDQGRSTRESSRGLRSVSISTLLNDDNTPATFAAQISLQASANLDLTGNQNSLGSKLTLIYNRAANEC